MNSATSKTFLTGAILAAGLALSACATEEYVDTQVGAVNTRVDGLSNSVNSSLNALNTRVDTVAATAQQAAALAATKADAKFAYVDTQQGASVNFDTNRWKLSPEAQATLTAFAERLRSENKDVYIEIVGHGDPRGSVAANRVLGAKRSLEVQRFLAGQGVALHRMNVVSWGEERVADPRLRTPEALRQSRRVDLIVKG